MFKDLILHKKECECNIWENCHSSVKKIKVDCNTSPITKSNSKVKLLFVGKFEI